MSIGAVKTEFAFRTDSLPVIDTRQLRDLEDGIFTGLFDSIYQTLMDSPSDATANRVLDELFLALRERKFNSHPTDWLAFVQACRHHRLMKLLHKDPFTFRAFSKPRGYAGDALMMDYIYGREEGWDMPETDEIGAQVFNFTTQAPASEGVRARRAFIAARIDRLAEERRRPHILSIASGHLREVNLSAAIRRRKTGRIVALDADALSLAEVRESYGKYGVETVNASFRDMLSCQSNSGDFDFVYSTGLFDYLNQKSARRLVTGMFSMLRSGGVLLVANFLPAVRDIGYMETFMNWNLIYRSRSDMADLTMGIPEDDVKELSIVSEECRNIVFLQLTKT